MREVLTIKAAAEYLGINVDTLYRYAAEAQIPAFKIGNRWKFRTSALNEWMDDRTVYLKDGPK